MQFVPRWQTDVGALVVYERFRKAGRAGRRRHLRREDARHRPAIRACKKMTLTLTITSSDFSLPSSFSSSSAVAMSEGDVQMYVGVVAGLLLLECNTVLIPCGVLSMQSLGPQDRRPAGREAYQVFMRSHAEQGARPPSSRVRSAALADAATSSGARSGPGESERRPPGDVGGRRKAPAHVETGRLHDPRQDVAERTCARCDDAGQDGGDVATAA